MIFQMSYITGIVAKKLFNNISLMLLFSKGGKLLMSVVKQVDFEVRPLNKTDTYFGFSLEDDPMYLMPDGSVFHNSGKSVCEQSIVGHVSRYSDRFQLVGVDCKRVEFNLLRGVKGVKGVALTI